MFYSQIVLHDGIPFDLRLPASRPTAIGAMSREQLDAELMKGMESLQSGKSYSADDVDAALAVNRSCSSRQKTGDGRYFPG